MTLKDLKHQNSGFIDFLLLRAATYISRLNCAKVTGIQNGLHTTFSALNADFNSPSPEPLVQGGLRMRALKTGAFA